MKTLINSIKLITLFVLLVPAISHAQLNGSYIISGIVKDDHGLPLVGTTVSIKGTTNSTASDSTGKFSLTTSVKLPYTLVFTAVGFQPQEFFIKNANSAINIQLSSQSLLINEVVVTASRKEEKLLRSPVAIEKLSINALKQSPGPSFYDALENVKGVQMTTTSITLKVPNTRGFNSPNNFRFMQLVDGVDMQSATLGVPLGNAIGPTELDIASIEITPGAAAALYGTNAINGLSNLVTKDPFKYQGLSVYHREGVNLAKADWFPHISLGGFVGFLSGRSNDFGSPSTRAWSVAPSISWPGLNVQRVRNNVKASEARADAALATYQRTVLQAVEDVSNALTGFNLQRERVQKLLDQVAQSRHAAELARVRYDEGAADFLQLLDAERTQLSAEDALAEAEAAINLRAVGVYKALGGGWEACGDERCSQVAQAP